MIKVFLYDQITGDKRLIAQLGDENQLFFFKGYLVDTYEKSVHLKITIKKPYKQEEAIVNTFKS